MLGQRHIGDQKRADGPPSIDTRAGDLARLRRKLTKNEKAITCRRARIVAARPLASSRRCLERRRLGGLQSKAGYDRIFERVTKAVERMVDGVCQKWDCVTHWYPPNMIVTKDEQPDGSVPLGSSMCSYFPPNGDSHPASASTTKARNGPNIRAIMAGSSINACDPHGLARGAKS
jgi:hypothetical protein